MLGARVYRRYREAYGNVVQPLSIRSIQRRLTFAILTPVYFVTVACSSHKGGSSERSPVLTVDSGNDGAISSTGGAASLSSRCDVLASKSCGGEQQIQVDVAGESSISDSGPLCDFPLQATPTVSQDHLLVAIDCALQPVVQNGALDASAVNGFRIDYNQTPAHLLLFGACCADLQASGNHIVDILVGCGNGD